MNDRKNNFEETLGNEEWLKENYEKLKAVFPQMWTHVANLEGPVIGFKLKVIGIDWRSEAEFGRVLMFFEKIGLIQRDNVLVRANPNFELS